MVKPGIFTRYAKPLALGLWLIVLIGFWFYSHSQGLGPVRLVQEWTRTISESSIGPLIFFAAYAVRPLLLFPVTLLMVAAGFLFGPLTGFALGFVASLASALLGYAIARFVLPELPAANARRDFVKRLQNRSFETVLISRFLLVPGDLVNTLAGFFRIDFRAFALASAIGGLPGLTAAVLFGASFEEFTGGRPEVDWPLLVASAALLGGSLSLSLYLRKRRNARLAGVSPEPHTG
jgi:uncharacterized membrane protein YdjX (TVP38/TMEM64 family)